MEWLLFSFRYTSHQRCVWGFKPGAISPCRLEQRLCLVGRRLVYRFLTRGGVLAFPWVVSSSGASVTPVWVWYGAALAMDSLGFYTPPAGGVR